MQHPNDYTLHKSSFHMLKNLPPQPKKQQKKPKHKKCPESSQPTTEGSLHTTKSYQPITDASHPLFFARRKKENNKNK